MNLPPKRRFQWLNKRLGEEIHILRMWANYEITSNEAAYLMSRTHQLDIANDYTAKDFEENAAWVGWRR